MLNYMPCLNRCLNFGARSERPSPRSSHQSKEPCRGTADVGFSCHKPLVNIENDQKSIANPHKSTIFRKKISTISMGHMNNSCVKLLEDKHRVKTWCIYIYVYIYIYVSIYICVYIYGFTVIHPVKNSL